MDPVSKILGEEVEELHEELEYTKKMGDKKGYRKLRKRLGGLE